MMIALLGWKSVTVIDMEGESVMPVDEEKEDAAASEPEKKPKGALVKIIIIVLAIIIAIGGSVAATLYFAGVFPGGVEESAEMTVEEGSSKKSKEKSEKKKSPKQAAIYFPFKDAFVVNFIDKNQIRYLQINVEVMSRDQNVIDSIDTHLPKIKNNLLVLFSDLDIEMITSMAGKQKLRDIALEELRKILKEEAGSGEVEALYFTGFVMQ